MAWESAKIDIQDTSLDVRILCVDATGRRSIIGLLPGFNIVSPEGLCKLHAMLAIDVPSPLVQQ